MNGQPAEGSRVSNLGRNTMSDRNTTTHRSPLMYRGVTIWPKNYAGMYSAIVEVPGGGQQVAADTLEGIRHMIRLYGSAS